MTRTHPGFTGVVQHEWPRPRGWTPPQLLESRDVSSLAGVGATLAKRLRAFGISTVRDLLDHAPRRYESAAEQVSIATLGLAEGEVAIEGRIVSARARPLRGRRTLVNATVRDGSGGQITAQFFNQPWLVEKLTPGTQVRLRGKLSRYGFEVKSYDVGEAKRTADFAPVYPASEQIPSTRLRELVRRALADHGRFLPDPLPAELDLPLYGGRARGAALPDVGGRSRVGTAAARARRADRTPDRRRTAADDRHRGAVARAAGRADRALPRRAAVRADRASGARDHRDRPRPGADDPDAAAAAGRRRLREDGRRAVRAAPRGREPASGRADGADGDAGRAALPHAGAALRAARRALRAPHRLRRREEDPRRDRERRCADRGRHACADPARRRVRRSCGRGRRRAAPVRRRAADGAGGEPRRARPAHDGDADPAHARADDLRRPRGERDREAAGEPQADRHCARRRRAFLARRTRGCASISTRAGRRTSSAR